MIRVEEAPARAAVRPIGDMVVISGQLIEAVIAALAADADYAGGMEVIGLPDGDIVNPRFRAAHYRAKRRLRRLLIEAYAHG